MSFSYDTSTNVGKVRLWIQDTVSSGAAFTDEEINVILSSNGNDIKLSAAQLLIILASSKAKLAKRKSAGKYSEDTSQIAKELREQAKAILEQGDEPAFEVAEQTFGPLQNPYEGKGEKEFIEREDLRDTI